MNDHAADDRWYSDSLDQRNARGETGATQTLKDATWFKLSKFDLTPVWGQIQWKSTSLLFKLGAMVVFAVIYLGWAWLAIGIGLVFLVFVDQRLRINSLVSSEWPVLIGFADLDSDCIGLVAPTRCSILASPRRPLEPLAFANHPLPGR